MGDAKLLKEFLDSNFDLRFFRQDWFSNVKIKLIDEKGKSITFIAINDKIRGGGKT